jgi:hypothetical protein
MRVSIALKKTCFPSSTSGARSSWSTVRTRESTGGAVWSIDAIDGAMS